jgi:hypothetical protein
MQLVGENFHVKFFRQKRQQIYQWKGKEKEKLELKEHNATTLILVLHGVCYTGGILLNLILTRLK